MKKIFLVLMVCLVGLLFFSCGKTKWFSDFDEAKKSAEKSQKDIFLFFSGDGWEEESSNLKDNVFHTKDFSKKYGKEFVFAEIGFTEDEFWEMFNSETPSKKEILARNYNVTKLPATILVSFEGYVLARFQLDEIPSSEPEKVFSEIESAQKEVTHPKSFIQEIRNSSGLEKAQAIDAFIKSISPEDSFLVRDIVLEFSSLDPENETGLLGEYELLSARYKVYDALEKGKDPSTPFIAVSKKPFLSDLQKQEALYTAAFLLANMPDVDFDRINQLLTEALEIDDSSEYAEDILQALEDVRDFMEKTSSVKD